MALSQHPGISVCNQVPHLSNFKSCIQKNSGTAPKHIKNEITFQSGSLKDLFPLFLVRPQKKNYEKMWLRSPVYTPSR